MKIVCEKNELLNGINIVSKAVAAKSSMHILECILITADQNGISLLANDTELGINTDIKGEVISAGDIAIEAKILFEIIRSLPDSNVTIDSNDEYLTHISCEKSNFNIVGRSSEEFSFLPDVIKENPIIISQYSLKEVIKQTIFSISDNDTNILMTGEYFEINDNNLKVVSLDGHRISVRKLELKNNYDFNSVIIPGKTLNEISKILPGNADSDVYIYLSENHVMFEFDNTVVVSRLIEGNYFKINQMLSNDYETKFDINKKDLLDCLQRASLLIKESDKKPIILTVNDDNIQLRINSSIGSMNEDISIEKAGKDIMIGFNSKFLIDALKVIDDETVTLYMVNPKAPCIIKNDSESYIYLVLPVNFVVID